MKTVRNNQNPVTIQEGYGVKGMLIELNLAQIQVLGSIYHSLMRKSFESLTVEEGDLVPFLETFKDFSLDRNTLWDNFKKEEVPEILA
jgi:hypothetical protein